MASKKVFAVAFRRKRKGKTDYKRRLSLLKSNQLRLVVRRSNKNMLAQIIKYGDKGDNIIATAHSRELEKFGWKISTSSIPASYLLGMIIGKRSKGKEVILDLGLQTPVKGSRLFAVVKGAIDGGIKIKVAEQVLPSSDRISGKHISKEVEELFEKTKQNIQK